MPNKKTKTQTVVTRFKSSEAQREKLDKDVAQSGLTYTKYILKKLNLDKI